MGGNVTLGYDADGRTLRIIEGEAETIRTFYDLYEACGLIRIVKDEADATGLVTMQRIFPDGLPSCGVTSSCGHIHQILSNPIYAGRIWHKGAGLRAAARSNHYYVEMERDPGQSAGWCGPDQKGRTTFKMQNATFTSERQAI